MADSAPYPCPCCGYMVFQEPPGSYSMCSICGWEDDAVQLVYLRSGGANDPLPVAQEQFLRALSERRAREAEAGGHVRCPDWRPLTPADIAASPDGPATGVDYFNAIERDQVGYYWRRTRG